MVVAKENKKRKRERERRWGTLCNCMGVNAKHKPMKTRHPNVGSVESDIDGSDAEMISQSNWSYSENHRNSPKITGSNAECKVCAVYLPFSPFLFLSTLISRSIFHSLSHSLARSLYRLLSLARSLTTQIVENNLCDWLKTLWMGRNQNNNLHQQ